MSEKTPTQIEVTSGEQPLSEFPPFAGDRVEAAPEQVRETTKLDLLESRGFYGKISAAEGKNVTKQRYEDGVGVTIDLLEDEVRAGRDVLFVSQNRGEESADRFFGVFNEIVDKRIKEGNDALDGRLEGAGDYYFQTTDALSDDYSKEFVAELAAKAEKGDARVLVVVEKVRDEEGDLALIDTLDRLKKAAPELSGYAEVITVVGDSDVEKVESENVGGETVSAPVYSINKISEEVV